MGLRELRLKRGLSQAKLGGKVGMSGGNIGDYETGRRPITNMTLGTALKLCDALRVSNPRKLLPDDGPGGVQSSE